MQVYINDQTIQIFSGARAGDAVRAYWALHPDEKSCTGVRILDRFGFETDPDGALREGSRLYIQPLNPNECDCTLE